MRLPFLLSSVSIYSGYRPRSRDTLRDTEVWLASGCQFRDFIVREVEGEWDLSLCVCEDA